MSVRPQRASEQGSEQNLLQAAQMESLDDGKEVKERDGRDEGTGCGLNERDFGDGLDGKSKKLRNIAE